MGMVEQQNEVEEPEEDKEEGAGEGEGGRGRERRGGGRFNLGGIIRLPDRWTSLLIKKKEEQMTWIFQFLCSLFICVIFMYI